MEVVLRPLEEFDRERFIRDNQWVFKYGSMEEFETRNIHFYINKCGFHIVEFYNPMYRKESG